MGRYPLWSQADRFHQKLNGLGISRFLHVKPPNVVQTIGALRVALQCFPVGLLRMLQKTLILIYSCQIHPDQIGIRGSSQSPSVEGDVVLPVLITGDNAGGP